MTSLLRRLEKVSRTFNIQDILRFFSIFVSQALFPFHKLPIIRSKITSTTANMPRNGDGSSDNAIEAGENKVHGAGSAPNDVGTHQSLVFGFG